MNIRAPSLLIRLESLRPVNLRVIAGATKTAQTPGFFLQGSGWR